MTTETTTEETIKFDDSVTIGGQNDQQKLVMKTTSIFENPPDGKKIVWTNLDYSWLEKEGIVEVFIDFEGANEIPDENIDLKLLNNDELDFKVYKEGKFYRFYIDALFDKIAEVKMKKKKDKFFFKMTKMRERIWYKITF